MTFEEKLAQAFEEVSNERTEQLMKIKKEHKFSLAYRLWEYKTLKSLKSNKPVNRWTLTKVRYALTSAVVAFSLLIGGTVYGAIANTGRYGFEDKVDYSKVFIEQHPSDKTTIEEYYGLPEEEGWELVEHYVDDKELLMNYKRGKNKVTFGQRIITEESIGNINTEKAVPEPVTMYEENDGFFLVFSEDHCALYWIYDGYLFDLHGNFTKDEAIKLAYSTKIVNLQKNS